MENLLIFMAIFLVVTDCIIIRLLYLITDAMYTEVDDEGDQ